VIQQEIEAQLDAYLANCGIPFAEIKSKSKIIYDPCYVTRGSNKYNINFILHCDTEEERMESQAFFSQLLLNELQLRRLQHAGTVEDRHNRLKQYLNVEQKLKMIVAAISQSQEGKETVMILIQAIPCIMHLAKHVGEKLITVLLAMAAERFPQERGVRSPNRFARNINHIVFQILFMKSESTYGSRC
jgi:hypothetical protein